MARIKPTKATKSVDHYGHKGKKRANIPPVGLVSSATDKLDGRTKYEHDPHIDPTLSWAGKKEGMRFEVPNVSLHIHERIDPQRIVKAFLKGPEAIKQMSLFAEPENQPPLNKAIDFYAHQQDWTNRLIAGDSLLVMNSLLQKEGMAGKVQMVYIDPPYGIKYNSNFQPFVNKRDVKDNEDKDIPAEPETIQAFRDTWELGIHSYLTYLRGRLLLAKDLLTQSGSCFVQINDENLHLVRQLMSEVFGAENFVAIISISKTAGGLESTKRIPCKLDYLVWFAKDYKQMKYFQLFGRRDNDIEAGFSFVELATGEQRPLSPDEKSGKTPIPEKSKLFRSDSLTKPGPGSKYPLDLDGVTYNSGNRWWGSPKETILKLVRKGRVRPFGNTLRFIKYLDDFPYKPLDNLWAGLVGARNPLYVVQTNEIIVERCLLMTTEPGDIVLDPTCGSGTTATVAEQWGRRWITCDTSRVSIAVARQRLMTTFFDYYSLAHSTEGVASGFKYKQVSRITMTSIANDEPPSEETLYDVPSVDKSKIRVTGPFTVEAVPGLRTRPFDGSEPKPSVTGTALARFGVTGNQSLWRDELKATGIRATGGKILEFARVEPLAGTRFLHAEGEIIEKKGETKQAVISFGPDYGPLEQRQVEEAIKESRSLKQKPAIIVFAAFHFDPEAAKDIDQIELKGVTILKAQMSVDLLTADLRKKRSSNQSYWLIGQPDVDVVKQRDGTYKVTVNGFDYYNPISGDIESGGTSRIAMWFLDNNYDERSLFPDQVFFPMQDAKRDWTRLAKSLNGKVDEEKLEAFVGTESLPFKAGENRKIAVKIIDDRGIESFVIKKLP